LEYVFCITHKQLNAFFHNRIRKFARLEKELTLTFKKLKHSKFIQSRKALGIPITYLILFVSTLLLISVTYVFAIDQLNSQKQPLQTLTAKQDMASLADDVVSVSSQPGDATIFDLRDSGGQLNVEPATNTLTLSVTDNNSVNAVIFNQTVGLVDYNLASFAGANIGFYVRGDGNTISNVSGATPSQLYFAVDANQQPALLLQYRPTVSYVTEGVQNNQSINYIRVYVINLNSSDIIATQGDTPIRISCTGTQLITETFPVTCTPGNLSINSQLGSGNGSISVPISSASKGAVINFEVVVCNVSIERCTI
jgi:hypothetical protein